MSPLLMVVVGHSFFLVYYCMVNNANSKIVLPPEIFENISISNTWNSLFHSLSLEKV